MKKVLIIDDDVDFRDSLTALLEHAGHEVVTAASADEGVAAAVASKPDVILCDVIMKQRTDGFFAVQRLRRTPAGQNARIVVISSVYQTIPDFQVPPESSWLRHDAFLRKPVDPQELLALVEADA